MKKNDLENNKPTRFKTNYNAHLFPKNYEVNDKPSLTIQNDALSLRDIVERFSREYPAALQRKGYYDFDESSQDNFDDVDQTRNPDFDYVDAHDLKQALKSKKEQKISSFTKKTTTTEKSLEAEKDPNQV